MNQYALYLRKSRADLDAEARGEGETLAKHRAALTALAQRRDLFVSREYAEIVSGDTIAARPQMQQLLEDVKAGLYAGVIVNDVDRLGRGDSIDQEIIKYTFASSRTLIITPNRDIDPANPTDDDMLDFSMFMARFEYKKISQRMMQGRLRSAASGKWLLPDPPFGYRIGDGLKLVPDPGTAPIVRMIFDWYAQGEAGYGAIAKRLNGLGISTSKGHPFGPKAVQDILRNPAYIGRVEWGKRSTVRMIENGAKVKRRQKSAPSVVAEAHEPIIAPDVWAAVQSRVRPAPPVTSDRSMQNPLSGIVYCGVCHKAMIRNYSVGGKRSLICKTPGCPTSGTYLPIVEGVLIDTLRGWCAEYSDPPEPDRQDNSGRVDALNRQLETVSAQIKRAQELVEMCVYTPSEYLQRRAELDAQKAAISDELSKLTVKPPSKRLIVAQVLKVLDAYPLASSATEKNALLRSVVSRVEYHKTRPARRGDDPAQFITLDVFPAVSSHV